MLPAPRGTQQVQPSVILAVASLAALAYLLVPVRALAVTALQPAATPELG